MYVGRHVQFFKSLVQGEKPADKQLSAYADQGEDEPDALVVEQQHLQNWDPVSITLQLQLSFVLV